MTQEEILEGNKIIAEFMEVPPFDDCRYGKVYKNPTHETGIVIGDSGLRYHSSFDWIMPVVEKIEGMGYEIEISSGSVSIYDFDVMKSGICRANYKSGKVATKNPPLRSGLVVC